MPAKFSIADEVQDDRVAQIFSDKSVRTSQRYTYYTVPSGTATAAIATTGGVLHSVIFTSSAAGASFWLFDSAGTANDIGNSASAVARYSGIGASNGSGTHLYNAILGSGLTYRLSAAVADGITVVYRKD